MNGLRDFKALDPNRHKPAIGRLDIIRRGKLDMLKHDYAAMPIGATIEQGAIQVCPYCNRAGIKETVQDRDFYTHSQWSGFDSNGQFSLGWDMCPKSFATETTK